MARKILYIYLLGFIVTGVTFLIFIKKTTNEVLFISDNINSINYNNFENININDSYKIDNLTASSFYDIIIFNEIYNDNELTIKQLINKNDKIIISIGQFEMNNNHNIKLYIFFIEKIFDEIRKITNNEVYILSLYSENIAIKNVNEQLQGIAKKYSVIYVDISDVNKNEHINYSNNKLNNVGEEYITTKLKKYIN